MELSKSALDEAFAVLDADNSGTISFEEFSNWITSQKPTPLDSQSGALKAKLRTRMFARRTKQLQEALENHAKAKSGKGSDAAGVGAAGVNRYALCPYVCRIVAWSYHSRCTACCVRVAGVTPLSLV